MSILSSMNKSIKAGLIAALVIGSGALAMGKAQAISLSGGQDCDTNAVIWCGAQSTQTLISKYTNGDGHNSATSIHDIYTKFGISGTEVGAMNTTAVAGRVTSTNEVFVGDKLVGKNALTAGRGYISGSTHVTYNGTSFYTRAPSVSFRSSSIPAYVVMRNNVFQYAILESCANPVTATPTTTPPPVTPPTPPATPNYTIVKSVAIKGSVDYRDSIAGLKPGTHVIYQIVVKSTGKAAVTNLVVKDRLPAHITYVPSTLSRDGTAIAGTTFFGTGVTVASLAAGATTSFKFEAVVGTAAIGTVCTNETLTNTGTISATSLPATSDTAVVSTKCAPIVIANAPTCDNFEIGTGDNRTIHVTKFSYTPNDATFVSAVINWDIDKSNDSTDALNNANSVLGQSHQYAADGKYLVGVTVNFTQIVNGKPVTVSKTGAQCEKLVTFSSAPPVVTTPPVTPTPVVPVALANTGAGSSAALFGAASVIAFAAYQWSLRRRLSL